MTQFRRWACYVLILIPGSGQAGAKAWMSLNQGRPPPPAPPRALGVPIPPSAMRSRHID